MALYFTFKPPIVPWVKRQVLWFKTFETRNETDDFDKGYLKIIFYFYQAANLLLVSSSAQQIVKTRFVDILVGLFNFQQKFSSSGLICPLPGITKVTKSLLSGSHVLGTCLMISIIYATHRSVQKFRGREIPSSGPYIAGILQTMLVGYTTLATVSFDLLRCVPLGLEKRLFYDGNVKCFQWWQYILITFVCAFFVPFVFALFWGCYKLYSRKLSGKELLFACFFPLLSLLYWAFTFLIARRKQANKTESLDTKAVANNDSPSNKITVTSSIEKVLYDSFKRPEDGGKLCLGWESFMIGRRLILILLGAFFSDPFPRLLIMNLLCVLFLFHHSTTRPFRDNFANTVETISLLFLTVLAFLNVFFASFLSLAMTPDAHLSSWWNFCQVAQVIILCLVPALFCLLVVAAVLSQLGRFIIVVCHYLSISFWICFSMLCKRDRDEESRPLRLVS